MATAYAIATQFIGVDKMSPVFDKIDRKGTQTSKNISSNFSRVGDKMDAVGRKVGGAFKNVAKWGAVSAIGAGTFAVKKSISTYLDFEKEMLTVKAITKSTEEDYKKLTNAAMSAAQNSVFTASETAQAMKYLGMAGWKTNEIISATPAILQLAAASQMDLATTSDILSDVMTTFKLDATQATHAADVFAGTVTTTNTDVLQLGEAFKDAAPSARIWGASIEETSALLGTMANNSIKGTRAGTAFKNIVLRLAKPTEEAQGWLKKLNIKTTDQTGNFRNLTDVMGDLKKGFDTLNPKQQAMAKNAIFGKIALAGANAVLETQHEKIKQLTNDLTNNKDAAKQMAETQLSGAYGAVEKMKSAVDVMVVQVGAKLAPLITQIADAITDIVSGTSKERIEKGNISALERGVRVQDLTDSFEDIRMSKMQLERYVKWAGSKSYAQLEKETSVEYMKSVQPYEKYRQAYLRGLENEVKFQEKINKLNQERFKIYNQQQQVTTGTFEDIIPKTTYNAPEYIPTEKVINENNNNSISKLFNYKESISRVIIEDQSGKAKVKENNGGFTLYRTLTES